MALETQIAPLLTVRYSDTSWLHFPWYCQAIMADVVLAFWAVLGVVAGGAPVFGC